MRAGVNGSAGRTGAGVPMRALSPAARNAQGGVLFPLLIDVLTSDSVAAMTYWRFLFSFTVSGLIALTYSVIATEFVVVRVLYPGLWLDARGLRSIHEWVGGFERFWNESFDRLDEYVQELKQATQEEPQDDDDR